MLVNVSNSALARGAMPIDMASVDIERARSAGGVAPTTYDAATPLGNGYALVHVPNSAGSDTFGTPDSQTATGLAAEAAGGGGLTPIAFAPSPDDANAVPVADGRAYGTQPAPMIAMPVTAQDDGATAQAVPVAQAMPTATQGADDDTPVPASPATQPAQAAPTSTQAGPNAMSGGSDSGIGSLLGALGELLKPFISPLSSLMQGMGGGLGGGGSGGGGGTAAATTGGGTTGGSMTGGASALSANGTNDATPGAAATVGGGGDGVAAAGDAGGDGGG